ncbi:hypothetical protein BKE38_11020 [Pseudoroseomonas deserti]|uniref:Uncharacterized protein n=1 Tax=Teichococcus deserti TaxID=1817963 RepID=A0A1V2H3H8_9PROT|nr:hypothetical protein [Pseudoroseomonas deserti]ONG53999.1 hypothetical protein BKE38_11020 [Pseudoroseomonas deserti]
MPRRPTDLIQVAMSDPRFRLLSFAEVGFWVHLMNMLLSAPVRGQLQFPGTASVPALVSRLVSTAEPMSETEAETQLQTFCELGLIELDEASRTIFLAGARDTSRRAEAARINGLKGGRPRKGETLEERRERRQGSFMLPIRGGLAEPQETEAEPNGESSRAVLTTTTKLTGSSSAREETEAAALVQELTGLAGFRPRMQGRELEIVAGWQAAGVSAEGMRAVVQEVANRASYDPGVVKTLGYFTPAMHEAAGLGAQSRQASAAPLVYNPPRPPAAQRDAQGFTADERSRMDELRAMVRDGLPRDNQRRINAEGIMRHLYPHLWDIMAAELDLAA